MEKEDEGENGSRHAPKSENRYVWQAGQVVKLRGKSSPEITKLANLFLQEKLRFGRPKHQSYSDNGLYRVPALLQCRAQNLGIVYHPLRSSSGIRSLRPVLQYRARSPPRSANRTMMHKSWKKIPTTHFTNFYSNFRVPGGAIRK